MQKEKSKLFDKVACFTDIHFGMKNNSRQHNNDCEAFIHWFIDQAKEFGAKQCIFLGDWHHHRSSINVSTLNYSMSNIRRISKAFEKVYFIVGNHDLFYRDKREISSVPFADEFENVQVINDLFLEGDVAIVPWMVEDEWKKIKKIKAKYMFGHFELPNFKMNAMVEMPDTGTIQADHFKNVGHVFTGHFHKRQHSGNISYIGNAFPHNYADAWDDNRGCMLLEWGQDPVYKVWPDAPRYRTIELSKLLADTETVLQANTYCRVKVDLDISYEEANYIRENLTESYQLRELALLPQKDAEDEIEFAGEIKFQSVDQIVIEQLKKLESETFDNNVLVEIYTRL
jgi:DNA repair exonuclease SbcCD nuclease subunit|tara:strand:- start:2076 stop:3101 length:1026 start_codon:yes stop_codon:yes gene_type:complete